jgi:hypothetical protein
MELRPSAKIAIAISATLGTIGILHLLIFDERAKQYDAAKTAYTSTYAQYIEQGTSPDINVIHRFRYATAQYKLAYWQTLSQLRVAMPRYYGVGLKNFSEYKRRMRLKEFMHELEKLRDEGDAGEGPKLNFLGERGWNFATSLPRALIDARIEVGDELEKMKNEDKLIARLAPGSDVHTSRRAAYAAQLARVGLDTAARARLSDTFGELVATWLTLNRIDQVMRNLPADTFEGWDETRPTYTLSEQEQMEEMFRLFQIEWPKDADGKNPDMLSAERQAEGLLEILRVAKEEKIEEVNVVKLFPVRNIRWKERKAVDATPTPAAMMNFGEFGDGGFFGLGGFGMMGSMFGAPAGFGMNAGAAPKEQEPATAFGAPIEIQVTGSNQAVMGWLYRLSQSPNPLELDRLNIRVAPDGRIVARAFFNVVTYALYLGTLTEEEIDMKIVEAQREIADLAVRPGARDLALRDGVIRLENGQPVLVAPSPTPWGGIEPTPEPPAAFNEMGF